MPKLIIGITGYKGSGKTSGAEHLHQVGFTRVRFAGILKQMLRVLGCEEQDVDGDFKEIPSALLCDKTPRFAMQTLGTEWGRQMIGDDIWVNAWRKRVESYGDHTPIVVDDLRFENEAQAVLALGGFLIWVRRPGHNPTDHASEDLRWLRNYPHSLVDNETALLSYYNELDNEVVNCKEKLNALSSPKV